MIELPFPPAKLSPNARVHWGVRARAFKAYKFQCFAIMAQFRDMLRGRNKYSVTFHPPAAHRYDLDGLITRFKAAQDALAEVSGVNDFHFEMTYARGDVRPGGSVVLK